jgi:hypothetical protein
MIPVATVMPAHATYSDFDVRKFVKMLFAGAFVAQSELTQSETMIVASGKLALTN